MKAVPRLPKVYAVIGCPGSGKTWICSQVKDKFNWLPHDEYINKGNGDGYFEKGQNRNYVDSIINTAGTLLDKPILIEIPFSTSKILTPLLEAGLEIEPILILETNVTIASRYHGRTGKRIPAGHLKRQETLRLRACLRDWRVGTAQDILDYLKGV